jgi:hypothetical protein
VAAVSVPVSSSRQPWLRDARWDLTFVVFSAVFALAPYSIYALVGGDALATASTKGTATYNARLLVNTLVAILVGGPHMYATFTRTIADPAYRRRRSGFLVGSLVVPVAVFTLAVLSYETYVWLLSIFFAVASLHALHQIVWVTEAYNRRAGLAFSWPSRLVDYGVVLLSLYPVAVYRMARGEFAIGPVALKYGTIVAGWYWLAWLVGLAFAGLLALFVGKTIAEHRAGTLNVPKTALIGVAVLLDFCAPLSPNLDTAFQGVNTWHSFQYLALTWWANRLREESTGQRLGFLHWLEAPAGPSPDGWLRGALRRLDGGRGWLAFYGVCLALLPISGALMLAASALWPNLHAGRPGADEAYTYMGILSVLLVHYVHDALLFGNSEALVGPG